MSRQTGDTVAIILAAGSSSRMGTPKLLLPWQATTVLGRTLEQLAASRVDGCLLVTGAFQAEVERIAAAHAVPTVHNPQHADGEMISSLQTGLRTISADVVSVLVVLGDMPLVQPQTIDALIAAFRSDTADIVAPLYDGRRGNPVLFGRALFAALLALPPGSAPRDALAAQRDRLLTLPVDDPGILIDLDDPQTYARWRPA